MTTAAAPPSTVAVLGIHGYGRLHLLELERLAAEGLAEVVAVADPRGVVGVDGTPVVPPSVPCHPDLATLLTHAVPDVVVLATPIHTHAPLAIAAMRAGAHVLLEKPTCASLAELDEVVRVSQETGRVVQVGFQSFGSHAYPEIEARCGDGSIGEVTAVGGLGTWLRTVGYYRRSRWAGMRALDGLPVVDGVVTNPLSHAVATALKIDGSVRAEDVDSVEVELYRANDIEADDTSSVRVHTRRGTTLTFALTLTAPVHPEPVVIVQGTAGSIRFGYTTDRLEITTADGVTEEQVGRTGLLRNLVAHLGDPTVPLLAPAVETGAFMRVLEAVRTAPDPTPIDPAHVTWEGEGDERHAVVDDIETWCARAVAEGKLFSELGAPWARR